MLQTTGKFLSRGASAAGVAVTMYDEYRKYDAGLQDGGDAIASGAGASPEGPSAVLWRVLLSALSLDR